MTPLLTSRLNIPQKTVSGTQRIVSRHGKNFRLISVLY
jgi:hypothetical protein